VLKEGEESMSNPVLEETRRSLGRLQQFDTASLPRVQQLGDALSFTDAVEPSERIIALFKQIPNQHLGDLPDTHLDRLREQADAIFSMFQSIQGFDPKQQQDPYNKRNEMIQSIKDQYRPCFDTLHPIISYTASRMRDFAGLEREARASMQAAKDRADAIAKELE
jgi:hypothetical protein